MSKSQVKLSWKEQMNFETEINGHKIVIDADEETGGQNKGPRPKAFMLLALAGCTGMDIVSILKKMRVEYTDLDINVDGDITEDHPKVFTKMHVTYHFWGKELPLDKIQKAVNLSKEKYCGVSATYEKAIPVTSEIILHEV